MKGNEAMAEAAIRAGCRFFFGYPITPQTEVAGLHGQAHAQNRRHVSAGRKRDRGHQHGATGLGLLAGHPRPGHGDFPDSGFAPATVQEMVDTVSDAFFLADTYRMPAMILADGMLGQMMEPVEFKDEEKPRTVDKPWATTGTGGKRKHNIVNSLYLQPDELEKTVVERFKRYELIKRRRSGWSST